MKTLKIFVLTMVMVATAATAFAQKYGATPEDSVNCVTNTFLYREFFNSKQYAEAYEPWKECLKSCPANNKNLYIRGATILKNLYNAATTVEDRNKIIDELMAMYDLRIQYFGEAAKVTALKASDMESMRGISGLKEYYALYAEAMRLGATELDVAYIDRYFDATIRYVINGNADTTLIIDNYDIASDALDKMAKAERDSAKLVTINQVIGNIEAKFSPFASCDELVKIYTKKFEATPDDLDLLKKITTIMRKKGCMKTDLFFAATQKLYSLEPSPATAYLMAQMCYNKDMFSDAIKYMNDAIKDAADEDKYNMYILLGLCYANTNSYGQARTAYNRASEIEPNKGEPYRLLAQLYAKGSRAIDDGLGGRSAYWAAVDQANRAIAVDSSPENVSAANKLISTYSSHFPKQSDAFMLDLIDGNSYTVPGWIGVTTRVRTRK